jgi:methionyl-tRNA formyltransferase
MKIVFMGTPKAAAVSLERLIASGHEIAAVYTQPDRPSGRGKRIVFSPVKDIAQANDIAVVQPVKIKTPEALEQFRSFGAEVAVVVAYGRILPEGFLTAFPLGAINVHFSLLPKYRGAAPVNWAIVNGEAETGVTTMKMDAGLDTGDILLQRSTPIGERENAVELMERLSVLGADLLIDTMTDLKSIERRKQNDSAATFAPIMKKEDGLIDWSMTADEIARRVRGFQPFPTSYAFYANSRLTIWNAAQKSESSSASPGTVINANGDELTVACGIGTVLSILEVQPEGKRRMSTRDFLNGAKLSPGAVLSSNPGELAANR